MRRACPSDWSTRNMTTEQATPNIPELKYDDKGLIAAVIQDDANNEILMVGYMNAESLRMTLARARTCCKTPNSQFGILSRKTPGGSTSFVR